MEGVRKKKKKRGGGGGGGGGGEIKLGWKILYTSTKWR